MSLFSNLSFQIHHIFPREAYRNDDIARMLNEVGILEDANGNKIGLLGNPLVAASLDAIGALSEKLGLSPHGFHSQYNAFVLDKLGDISDIYEASLLAANGDSALEEQALDAAIEDTLKLHTFAHDLSKGGVPPVTAGEQVLNDAWNDFQARSDLPDHVAAHATAFDPTITDATVLSPEGKVISSNIEFRTLVAYEQAKAFVDGHDAAIAAGSNSNGYLGLHDANFGLRQDSLDAARQFMSDYEGLRAAGVAFPTLTNNGTIFAESTYMVQINRPDATGVFDIVEFDQAIRQGLVDDVSTQMVARGFPETFARPMAEAYAFARGEGGYVSINTVLLGAPAAIDRLGTMVEGTFNGLQSSIGTSAVLGAAGGVFADVGEFLVDATTQQILQDAFESDDFSGFWSHAQGFARETIAENVLLGGAIYAIGLACPPLAAALAIGLAVYGAAQIIGGLYELSQNDALQDAAVGWAGEKIDAFIDLLNENPQISLLPMLFAFGPAAAALDLALDGAFFANIISPLVIDLDGDGVELISVAESQAYFDLDIDGYAQNTGWVAADDALLALDLDSDGFIDDGSELFGDQTGFANGFLALADHDLNSDGVIDANDAVFSDLIVWQDLDGNGYSSEDEMFSLTDVGITSIDLGYTSVNEINAGHDVLQSSTVTFADGSSHDIDDVYFTNDPRASVALLPDGFEFHADAFKLPVLFGYGHIASTWVSLSQDANLRADAQALVSQASSGDVAGFMVNFEQFLFEWAGVAHIDPDSRNSNIGLIGAEHAMDARHLAFLEKAYGEGYIQEPYNSPDPRFAAAEALTNQFTVLKEQLAGRFLAQVATSDGLLNATSQAEFETTVEASPFSDFASLTSSFSPSARSLDGDPATVFSSTVDAVQSGGLSAQDAVLLLSLFQHDMSTETEDFADMIQAFAVSDGSNDSIIIANSLVHYNDGLLRAVGTNGDDVLASGDAAFFAGRGGDDTIYGSTGDDIYFYLEGDGSDTIVEQDSFGRGSTDILIIADHLLLEELTFSINEFEDLVITVPDGGQITVVDFGANAGSQFERLEFSTADLTDENFVDVVEILAKSMEDQKPTGLVRGTVFDDYYAYELGDGSYTILERDAFGRGSFDQMEFVDLNANQMTFVINAGDDLVMTMVNGNVITVNDYAFSAYHQIEEFTFADGTIFDGADIRAKAMSDQKDSGHVRGTVFNDLYEHTEGDGSYSISERDAFGRGSFDRFVFSDLNPNEVTFAVNAAVDLVMTTAGGDVITIVDFDSSSYYQIEQISFADGTALDLVGIAGKISDDASGSGGSGHTQGTSNGVNQIGTAGDDVYVHFDGDGSYSIQETGSGIDQLVFADLNVADVTFANTPGGDLVMTTTGGETITVTDHFVSDYEDIEDITFADGTSLDLAAIRAKAMEDQKANGFVWGTTEVEVYQHAASDGSYTIQEYGEGLDQFSFVDLIASDVSFVKTNGGDLVMTTTGGDVITVMDHFVSEYEDIEEITFADGTTLDLAGIRAKAMEDQKATGMVRGTTEAESYQHVAGDGSYTIQEYGAGLDQLSFGDLNANDVSFVKTNGGDLVMATAGGDVITVTDHFVNDYEDIENVSFSDGTTLDLAAIRAKAMEDQKATGMVRGTTEADIYWHNTGDGSYAIQEYGVGLDQLTFADLNAIDVSFVKNNGGDLVMTTIGGHVITVADHFVSDFEDIENINFADGTTLDLAGIRAKAMEDQKATGMVRGTTEAESYQHSAGDGSYTIQEYGAGLDEFTFSDLNAADVSFVKNNDGDLVMTTTGGDVVTVTDHFVSDYEDIESFNFADGTTLDLSDIRAKTMEDQKATGMVRGTTESESYQHSAGDGSYTIQEYGAASDEFVFADLNETDLTFTETTGGDLVMTASNGDTITVLDHFASDYEDIELIVFADGSSLDLAGIDQKVLDDII